MNTTFKVQNIINQDPENKTKVAIAHYFDIDDDEKLDKLGRLYVVMSIESDEATDFRPLTKVFLDTLKDNYYQSSGETPLNAIEKALNKAYQTIISANNAELNKFNIKGALKISISTALIWHKILYVSYIHKPAVYLIRGSGVRNIAATPTTDGEIWTSSIILENEDVIIIGTEKFSEIAPPNQVMSVLNEISETIYQHPDRNLVAATLIKIIQNETDQKNPGVALMVMDKIKENSLSYVLSNTLVSLKDKLGLNMQLADKFRMHQIKKPTPVSSISGIVPTAQTQAVIETAKRINLNKNNKKNKLKMVLGILAVVICVSGFSYAFFRSKSAEHIQAKPEPSKQNKKTESKNEPVKPSKPTQPNYKELHTLIFNSADHESAYKVDEFTTIGTNQIAFINKSTKQPKVFKMQEKTIDNLTASSTNAKFVNCDQRLCYVYESGTILVFDPKTPQKIDRYLIENIDEPIDMFPYGNNIYILNNSTIYSLKLTTKEPETWLRDSNVLSNPIALAIDSEVFVLQSQNLLRLFNGSLTNKLDISQNIKEPEQIEVDAKNIYILDKSSQSILVYQKRNFTFVKEIKLVDSNDPNQVSAFSIVAEAGKTAIYFSKGGNVYKVEEKL